MCANRILLITFQIQLIPNSEIQNILIDINDYWLYQQKNHVFFECNKVAFKT